MNPAYIRLLTVAALTVFVVLAVTVTSDDPEQSDAATASNGGTVYYGEKYIYTYDEPNSKNITKMRLSTSTSGAKVYTGSNYKSVLGKGSEFSSYSGYKMYLYFVPTESSVSITVEYTKEGDWWDWSHTFTYTATSDYRWNLTFDANGGSITSSNYSTTVYGTTPTITFPSVSKSGSNFNGWRLVLSSSVYDTKQCNGTSASVDLANYNSSYGIGYDITFTAQWMDPTTITATENGDSVALSASNPSYWTITSGSGVAHLFTSAYGTANTLYADDNGTVTVKATNSSLSSDYTTKTFYVSKLVRDVNGGSTNSIVTLDIHTKTSSTSFTIDGSVPLRDGYTFAGWSSSSTATTATYTEGSTVSVGYASAKTLYAVWIADSHIYYDANGGSGAPGTDTHKLTSSKYVTLSFTQPTKSGCTFLGWSTSKTASSASYISGESYYLTKATDRTLYAVWGRTTTLIYNANGGSGAPATQSSTVQETSYGSYMVSYVEPDRSGYTFLGWSESSTVTTPDYYGGDSVSVYSGNTKTLYAVWQKAAITISGSPSSTYGYVGNSWSYTPELNQSGCSLTVTGASWLSAANGTIAGTPSAPGTYSITIIAEKSGCTSATQSFTLTILSALAFESSPLGGAIIYAI